MGKKDDQLGMPFGTANGRLKKMYLLRLLQRLGEDACYRCGKKIEAPEELSIEHKQPWLDIDPMLFWDLDNIAHSHHRCNSGASRQGAWTEERRAISRVQGLRNGPTTIRKANEAHTSESRSRAGRLGGQACWKDVCPSQRSERMRRVIQARYSP